MVDNRGPYVALAVICERVLQEKDEVLSIIRVIDRVFHSVAGADVPDTLAPFTWDFTLLVVLRSGEARGRYNVAIRPEAPSGQRMDTQSVPVLLEGEERGVNLIFAMSFRFEFEGLYWFDVLLEDPKTSQERLLTRVPLRVVYQPIRTGGATGPV
jgi:hypothetical protein